MIVGGRALTYRFAEPDHRDFKYGLVAPIESPIVLPPKVDLRERMPPVFDQGKTSSCTAQAAAAHKEFLDMHYVKRVPASRNFLYYCERLRNNDANQDAGATLRDSAEVLLNTGVCEERLWPFTHETLFAPPTEECFANARTHTIGAYFKIEGGSQMKRCLAGGFPFVFGLRVPKQLLEPETAKTGALPAVHFMDSLGSGHALLCAGYEATAGTYLIRNSWGPDWGQGGYFTIPSQIMESTLWVADCYTFRLARQSPPY